MNRSLHNVQRPVNSNLAYSAIADSVAALHNVKMQLKRIREARGLSLIDVAEMIGMSSSTIQRAETMQCTAKLET